MASPAPVDSIVSLIQALVRIPSRAVLDPPAPVLDCIEGWLLDHGLSGRRLHSPGKAPVGVYAEVTGGAGTGAWSVLDATLDTAGFGDPASWKLPPTDGRVDDGWLHGRGSADSKAGVALFAHLLVELAAVRDRLAGRVGVLFDLDEHSGGFGGARAFFDAPGESGVPPRPDHVVIGYPGADRIVTGGRGFLRARLAVHGVAAHSGSSRQQGINAIERAASLANRLASLVPGADEGSFALPPKLTPTGIHAGDGGFALVPDLCELSLDIRLTPRFTDADARTLVEHAAREHDAATPGIAPTDIGWLPGWPAFQVDDDSPLLRAMQRAASDEFGAELPTGVAGPSNIGNYLACLGVPALCGFGVRGENVHASDERIELASIAPAYRVYRGALRILHGA